MRVSFFYLAFGQIDWVFFLVAFFLLLACSLLFTYHYLFFLIPFYIFFFFGSRSRRVQSALACFGVGLHREGGHTIHVWHSLFASCLLLLVRIWMWGGGIKGGWWWYVGGGEKEKG